MKTLRFLTFSFVVVGLILSGGASRALALDGLAGDFLKENHIIEGSWFGGKNFTPNVCSRGFYSLRVKGRALLEKVEMNLQSDNELDVYGSLSNAYGRVEGDYLGDYSACQNASGWLGVGVDSIIVRAKVTVPDDDSKVTVRVYSLILGRVHLGEYAPEWFESISTECLNRAFTYIWETRLGDWLNQYISDYFNSLKEKRGI